MINSLIECYTLEDPDNKDKGPIPAGIYSITIDLSNRFKKLMPHVWGLGINDRGIRIHCGDTDADTLGCILVGQEMDGKRLYSSRVAYDHLFPQLEAAVARNEPITLFVKDL